MPLLWIRRREIDQAERRARLARLRLDHLVSQLNEQLDQYEEQTEDSTDARSNSRRDT